MGSPAASSNRRDSSSTSLLARRPTASRLLHSVFQDALFITVIFVGEELAGHGYLHAVTLGVRQALDLHVEVYRRHDAIAELFLYQRLPCRPVHHDQLVEAIDQWIGRRHRRATVGYFVEHALLGRRETK